MNELLSLGGGIVFVALSPQRAQAFMLSPMRRPRLLCGASAQTQIPGDAPGALALYESVEAREGVSTGISAADRALTASLLGMPEPSPRALVRPGHLFPVETRSGGVLVRNALPEGALDIVRLANYSDAAVYVDLLDAHGDFMSPEESAQHARLHHLPSITLSSLILLRLERETLVRKTAEARLPTSLAGELKACIYECTIHDGEHLALVKGEINSQAPVLTRVQPEFTFGDVFGGSNPPSRRLIDEALKAIHRRGNGVLVYLRRPAAGQLKEQIASWKTKFPRRPAFLMREYGIGAQILRDLGVRRVELLTSGSINLVGIKAFGMEIVSQQPILG